MIFAWWTIFQAQAVDHNLPASVAWRMANRLLPEHIQTAVIHSCLEPDFLGYDTNSWVQFVTRETGGKDCVLAAIAELRCLTPLHKESLSTYLLRFQAVALRASSASSVLETGLSSEQEFKILHSLMNQHGHKFGSWVKIEWHTHYNKHCTRLRCDYVRPFDISAASTCSFCDPFSCFSHAFS